MAHCLSLSLAWSKKMNLKLNGIILFIGLCAGAFLGVKFFSNSPEVIYKEKIVYSEKRSGTIKRKIAPDGSKEEIEEYSAEVSVKKDLKIQDNLLFIADTKFKEIDVMFKIEHLHIGLGYRFDNKEILYKLGYSTRIF